MLKPVLPDDGGDGRPATSRRVHLACYALLGGLMVYVLIARYLWPLVIEEPIGVQSGPGREPVVGVDAARGVPSSPPSRPAGPAEPEVAEGTRPADEPADSRASDRLPEVDQRIDPNVATWAELARLPRIGEAIAKRIIAYRTEQAALRGGDKDHPVVVFRRLEDLDAIRGIGAKTLARIAPYLKFPDRQQARPR